MDVDVYFSPCKNASLELRKGVFIASWSDVNISCSLTRPPVFPDIGEKLHQKLQNERSG
jgi:hypothetical protein